MKKWLIFLLALVFLVLAENSFVFACSPVSLLGLKDTIQEGDLIVVGIEIGEGPSNPSGFPYGGGPSWIDVRVTEVLKGNISNNPIRIETNEACGYGLGSIGKDKKAIFFLDLKEDNLYGVVWSNNYTKGIKGYWPMPIENETVYYDFLSGNQTTLDNLVREYNLTREQTECRDNQCVRLTFWQKIANWFKGLFD
jgi:hypothetical protein